MVRIFLASVVLFMILDAIFPGVFLSINGKIGLFSVVLLLVVWEIYSYWYFNNEKFLKLKFNIEEHTIDCNNLNEHLEELKKTRLDINSYDYGLGDRYDTSRYRFKRNEWKKPKEMERFTIARPPFAKLLMTNHSSISVSTST